MEAVLDLRKSLPENADAFYQKGKKAKDKVPGIKEAIEETERKLEDAQKEVVRSGKQVWRQVPKKWYHRFRWFTSSDGLLVVGGRDATSNEVLVKRHVEPHDVVFHADTAGAPFVVIKNEQKGEIPEATLNEAAQEAASFSRAWAGGLGATDVYWVNPEQVSKEAPAGQYLTKGSFMIRGQKNYFRSVALKAAVGFVVGEDGCDVVGGPESAVAKMTPYYAVVSVGDLQSKSLAEKVRENVLRKAGPEAGPIIKACPIDSIQRVLPHGSGRVI
ncbi:Uncharacterised protein [uncultured archaeon]|nr:Uncharacterised protein [uncultured archaeon]